MNITEQQIEWWANVIEGTDPPRTAPSKPTHLTWRVTCEHCSWLQDKLELRTEAIRLGRNHVHEHHDDDEEWEIRIQGIRY